jgi:hypothetical protein
VRVEDRPGEEEADSTSSVDAYGSSDPNIGLGCPGDPNIGVVDMETYTEATIDSAKEKVTEQAELFPFLCVVSVSAADPQACVAVIIKAALATAKALFSCGLKCETDYKNAKGNGGPNDDLVCCSSTNDYGTCTPDANYIACRDKAFSKGEKTAAKDPDAAAIYPGTKTSTQIKVDNSTLKLFDDTPSCP